MGIWNFWYRTRSQIRTKASGFQFCKGDGFRTVFIVAGKYQILQIQLWYFCTLIYHSSNARQTVFPVTASAILQRYSFSI